MHTVRENVSNCKIEYWEILNIAKRTIFKKQNNDIWAIERFQQIFYGNDRSSEEHHREVMFADIITEKTSIIECLSYQFCSTWVLSRINENIQLDTS